MKSVRRGATSFGVQGSRWTGRPPGRVGVSLIVGCFLAVTVLRWFVDHSGQAVALLYVVPIALSALWYGRRAGRWAAALGASLFLVLAAVHGRGDLDLTGWVSPVLAMGMVGGLVGHLAERAAQQDRVVAGRGDRSRRLEELCARQQAALEVSDSMVQDVAAARWMLEAGRVEQAIDVLGAAVADGISGLSQAIDRQGDRGGMTRG